MLYLYVKFCEPSPFLIFMAITFPNKNYISLYIFLLFGEIDDFKKLCSATTVFVVLSVNNVSQNIIYVNITAFFNFFIKIKVLLI